MKRVFNKNGVASGAGMRFQAQHPLAALTFYLGVFTVLFLFDGLLETAVLLLWMAALSWKTAGGRKTLRLAAGALLFGLFLLLINPLVNSEGIHILFYLGERPVTLESLLYGVRSLLLVTALLLVFPSFNLLLDSERILFLFSRFLHTSALILTMSMRFVPLLTRRARELMQMRGQEGGGLFRRLKKLGTLLGALLDWTMEEGMKSARTLRARGYGGRGRTFYSAFRFTARDACALGFLAMVLAALLVLRGLGAGAWMYFPAFSAPPFRGRQAAVVCLLCLYCGYPFWLEAGSWILRRLDACKRRDILV